MLNYLFGMKFPFKDCTAQYYTDVQKEMLLLNTF